MAQRIWGIDLGTTAVKICKLQSGFRSVELEGFVMAPVLPLAPPQPSGEGETPPAPSLLDAQLAALRELLGESTARPEVTVVALPALSATHLLSLPFTDTRRIEQTLNFEVEGQIPFDLSEVVFDYQLLGQHDGRSDLIVGVAKKEAVEELLAGLSALGLDPRVLTLPSLALQALATPKWVVAVPEPVPSAEPEASNPPESGSDKAQPIPVEGAEAILDLGDRRCNLLVRDQGRLAFARSFDGGGAAWTRAIAHALDLDPAEAQTFKETRASLDVAVDPVVAGALSRALLPLLRELRQTLQLASSRTHKPIARLWLTGGSSQLPGLPELFRRELGSRDSTFEVAPLPFPSLSKKSGNVDPQVPPPSGGESVPEVDRPETGLALALALVGHQGARSARFNLRRGDQSFQGDFTKLRGRVGRLAALAAALLLCFGIKAYARIYLLGQREKQLDDAICGATKQAVGKCVKDVNVAKSVLAGAAGVTATIPQLSALDLLTETTARLNIEGAKLTEIDIGTNEIQMRGSADSFETVDKVVAGLKGYRCFQDVQRGRVQRTRDGKEIEFNLSVRNGCVGGPA